MRRFSLALAVLAIGLGVAAFLAPEDMGGVVLFFAVTAGAFSLGFWGLSR